MTYKPEILRKRWGRTIRRVSRSQAKTVPDEFRRAAIWSSRRYRRFAAWVKAAYPLCCDPFDRHAQSGLPAASVHVHHVVPLRESLDSLCDLAGVLPVCHKCHARLEALPDHGAAFAKTWHTDMG